MKNIDKIKECNIYEMAILLSKLIHPQYVEPFREQHIKTMVEYLESESEE